MKQLYSFIFCQVILTSLVAQVVSSTPALPTDEQAVVITFFANQGAQGLKDYDGDIYAHTGLITNKSINSGDWQYVKANWDENKAECKLNKISDNTYTLTISPSIRDFYGVPANESIEKIALVFRSADGSAEGKDADGKDIFIDVFESGLQVSFTQPQYKLWHLLKIDSMLNVSAITTEDATITLTLNNDTILQSTGNNINTNIEFSEYGNHTVSVIAEAATATVTDSFKVIIIKEPQQKAVPAKLQNGINYTSDTSVTLVLHAPNKNNILLLGDFNNWIPTNDYILNKDGEYWWIELNGLQKNKEYAFQYLVDGEMLIADPYTEKILDPWNDPFIPESVYPNLKAYPKDKTEGIVSILHPGKTKYNWNISDFNAPNTNKLVIYELLIRDFVESHDIKEVQNKLDYLQELGVNAIELMPINEFEGNSSWGYNPSFYFATDKYYGTSNDYKAFIDECHKRGIAVIMDIVLNHAFGQCPLAQLYFDASKGEHGQPTAESPWFNETSPNPTYYWGYDFNHEAPATQAFVDRVIRYWLTEYNLDGFRFDFTKGFTNKYGEGWEYDASRIRILKRIYDTVKAINPDAYVIMEHLAENSEEQDLANYGMLMWGNSNYAYNESTMGYLGKANLQNSDYKNHFFNDANLIPYMESHDEERLMFKNITYGNAVPNYDIKELETALKRNALAANTYFIIPGPKMIWQFGELGYDYSIDYNGRTGEKPVRWDYLDNANRKGLFNTYSKLIELKTELPIFNTTNYTAKIGSAYKQKTVLLEHEGQYILSVGNFSLETESATINFPKTGWWYEYYTGDSLYVFNNNEELELHAGEYRLYSNNKLDSTSSDKTENKIGINIYPNPASEYLFIKGLQANQTYGISIQSVTGNVIHKNETTGNTPFMLPQLNTGMYLINIYLGDEHIGSRKLLIG